MAIACTPPVARIEIDGILKDTHPMVDSSTTRMPSNGFIKKFLLYYPRNIDRSFYIIIKPRAAYFKVISKISGP